MFPGIAPTSYNQNSLNISMQCIVKLVSTQTRISYIVSGILKCVYKQCVGALHFVVLLWMESDTWILHLEPPYLSPSPCRASTRSAISIFIHMHLHCIQPDFHTFPFLLQILWNFSISFILIFCLLCFNIYILLWNKTH